VPEIGWLWRMRDWLLLLFASVAKSHNLPPLCQSQNWHFGVKISDAKRHNEKKHKNSVDWTFFRLSLSHTKSKLIFLQKQNAEWKGRDETTFNVLIKANGSKEMVNLIGDLQKHKMARLMSFQI
jgi:hypothetical protein